MNLEQLNPDQIEAAIARLEEVKHAYPARPFRV
jgi:hypothetical protein